MRYRTTIAALLGAAVLLTGCSDKPQVTSAPPAPSTTVPPSSAVLQPDSCASFAQQMTPRQRLAQLLVVGVDASKPAAAVALVRDQQIGGIFIGGNATALLQGNALDEVQRSARWGLSVAVDEEGGRVQRIDGLDGPMPSAREMAHTMTVEQVQMAGRDRGRQLRARGITVDFAPSLDVSSQPASDAIGDRSFSPDPRTAREYALAFATGLREGDVTPVLKHFPGHGHAQGDSHNGLVTTPPLDSLRDNDLVPYESIADFGPSSVMVGHLAVPGLTGDLPASLSPEAYRLLRSDYHFTGPAITDDLGAMKAITASYSLPDAVLRALQAGADQALWSSGGDVTAVLDRLEQALTTGELPAGRAGQALGRVLAAKHACG